ncbi:MAG TPA: hypothetical protein DCQ36_04365 [Actinobacteria bacterium]|jgi:uncharacterized YccA/Bax inhibitor family protein|nr:hypothetical protein [Actinomycetota bacterium]
MESNNPVLTRYETKKGAPGTPGYAYDEGVSAYQQAATGGSGADIDAAFAQVTAAGGARLTINDVIVKTFAVFLITVVTAFIGYALAPAMPWVMWVGMIGGLGLGFANALMRKISPALVLLYGVFQGVFLGGISYLYASLADGIILQAVVATMVTFGVMLTLYLTGVIKVTKKFQSIMIVALVSYLVLGIGNLIWSMFGGGDGMGIYGTGFGPIVAVIGVLIAAFFLLLDFEAISQGIKAGVPERESWRMAFGLLVTLIWLYLEFLRLLSIFSRN